MDSNGNYNIPFIFSINCSNFKKKYILEVFQTLKNEKVFYVPNKTFKALGTIYQLSNVSLDSDLKTSKLPNYHKRIHIIILVVSSIFSLLVLLKYIYSLFMWLKIVKRKRYLYKNFTLIKLRMRH
jgi:hypothetical protein